MSMLEFLPWPPWSTPASIFFLTLLGASLGSFGAAFARRLPEGLSINGRSRCDSCQKKLAVLENIPVLSFIWLRGRCSGCGARIPRVDYLAEIFGALVIFLPLILIEGTLLKVGWLVFCYAGLILSIIDFRFHLLPNRITWPLALIALIAVSFESLNKADWTIIRDSLISGISLWAFFILLHLLSRGGMGRGDAKFAISIGILGGTQGPLLLMLIVSLAFFTATCFSMTLLVRKKANRKTAIAFGPFLYLGTILGLTVTPLIQFS